MNTNGIPDADEGGLSEFLNEFLSTGSDNAFLDEMTLAAICGSSNAVASTPSGLKRDAEISGGESDEDDNKGSKRPKCGEAARAKASREKLRREKLNEKRVAKDPLYDGC
jgi:hypothetical protein